MAVVLTYKLIAEILGALVLAEELSMLTVLRSYTVAWETVFSDLLELHNL